MDFLFLISNILTATFLMLHTYFHYKTKKDKTPSKHYPYIFILISLLLAFEGLFSFILKIIPFYSAFKIFFLFVTCFPQTNMSQKIYKEYVYRMLVAYENNIDHTLHGIFDWFQNNVVSIVMNGLSLSNQYVNEKIGRKKSIELKDVEVSNSIENKVIVCDESE